MRQRGKLDLDWVVGTNDAAGSCDAHDAGFANDIAVAIDLDDGGQKARLKSLDLRTGIAQAGHFQDDLIAKMKKRSFRKSEKIDTERRDVLAELGWLDGKTFRRQFGKKLRLDQMHLAKIGLGRIDRDARAMLHRHALMSIAFHPKAGEDSDLRHVPLGKTMNVVDGDGNDGSNHHERPPLGCSQLRPACRETYRIGMHRSKSLNSPISTPVSIA